MSEQFVNRYVVLLGRCGLNGTSYEVHALPDDLEELGRNLIAGIAQYRAGIAPMQRSFEQAGMPLAEGDAVRVLSENVTLSQQRTDRMSISFHAAKSLDGHHVIKRPEQSAAALGLRLARALWFVALPLVGAAFSLYAAFYALLRLFSYASLP